ncbi:sensor histidine kinase [Dyella silvatica]|uniref:sensor histidine kinase n=1 Tax=Dyella silvatica TaxID=2992128 RepID=UPI002255A139|nr:ATP-binding protein [Dyella silvatica]
MSHASLRTRLTLLIIAVMMAVLIPLGVLSYRRELREMNELLDGRLAQAGRTLGVLIEHSGALVAADPASGNTTPAQLRNAVMVSVRNRNYEPEVGFQAYDRQIHLLLATDNLADLPAPTAEERGFRDLTRDGHQWRTFTLQNRAGLVIRIGERYDNRQDITRGLILEHGLPLLIGLPLLALLVSWAVYRGLRPLNLLTAQLAERTPGSRQPIAADKTPREIKPLIVTLNQQLERLEDALEREHRFNADVAHELRTPLAATMIHLESAALAKSPLDTDFGLKSAQQSLARLARRIEQILALARLEAGAASQQQTRLDLIAIATEVIEELAPIIAEKDIAFGLVHDLPHLYVLGHEVALTSMFRNLIENALRYVSEGGQVEVMLDRTGTEALIDIRDDGPGIPPERRAAVFDRFHREAEGSSRGYGLGLSIVQRAAQLHGAELELRESAFGHGLHVHIRLALAEG